MKQIYFLPLAFLMTGNIMAQKIVSTNPENKSIVLEEFTGVNCQFCPDGHAKAQAIYDANPDRTVLINVHAGSYANPSGTQPDFRTAFGEALANQTGLTGYPSGTVNRHLFGSSTVTALDRNNWANNGKNILGTASPVNVGVISSFDPATRELTISTKLYYTEKSKADKNFIHVAFIENGFIGWQTDASGNKPNYVHNHILRNLITGQWGAEIPSTNKGDTHDFEYKYTVPEKYDINKCDIAVFVSESKQEIYTGKQVKANGGTTLIVGNLKSSADYHIINVNTSKEIKYKLTNELNKTEDFKIELSKVMPSDWKVTMKSDGQDLLSGGTISLEAGQSKDIVVSVLSSDEKAYANIQLTASSVSNPNAKSLSGKSYLMNDVRDLIISHTNNVTYVQNYDKGLESANNSDNASIPEDLFFDFIKNATFTQTKNIYYNVGWSFPSLTENMSTFLASFLDNGGNLFIAGQDIGWDTWDPTGSSGASKKFYTDYLKTKFISDGAATTKQFNPVTTDEIFGKLEKSKIIDVYGGSNVYPEVIQPLGDAKAIYKYEGSIGTGGIRHQTDKYKVVYLGVNLEQIENEKQRFSLIKTAHDWFYGVTSTNNLEENQFSIYPNPTSSKINIVNTGSFNVANLTTIDGKVIASQKIVEGLNQLDITGINKGTYFISLKNTETGKLKTSKIQIAN